MKMLRPNTIGDAQMVSINLPETDAPVWASGTTYAQGQRAMWAHQIWESSVAGNVGNQPDAPASTGKWFAVGPTNAWAMFDRAVGTLTVAGNTLTVVLKPGYVDALAFLETQAASASITMVHNGTVVHDRTISFEAGGKAIDDWYKYFFFPVGRSKSMVVEGLPLYAEATLTVQLTHETQVQCGVMLMGMIYGLGDTLNRPTLTFTDFSRKVTNDFGATDFVERPFAKKASLQVKLPTSSVDDAMDELTKVRARPVLYIGDGRLDWLRVYGIAKRAEITVEYIDFSYLTLDLEGLI